MNLEPLSEQMLKMAIFLTCAGIGGAGLTIWLMYAVIKAAVREGIRESGLIEALRYRGTSRQAGDVRNKHSDVRDLPEMRAD